MRKLLIVVALAATALGGAVACSSGTPSPGSSSSSAPTGSSSATASGPDVTAQVCTDAIALEKKDAADVLTKVNAALASLAANQPVDTTQLQADLTKIQSDWVTTFQGYSAENVKPEVRTALNNFVQFVQSISASNTTSLTDATQKFNQLDQALVSACA